MPSEPKTTDFLKLTVDEQVDLINKVLEPEVYPALEMDGGGMEIMDIQGAKIFIQYRGACGGCPVSETATGPFIEKVLQTQIDPRIEVVIIHADEPMETEA